MQPSRLPLTMSNLIDNREQAFASSSRAGAREMNTLGGFTRIETRSSHDRDDAWIEISSQPSDDTYSSPDDFLTDGLTLSPSRGNIRRRRKHKRNEILPGRGLSKAYDNSADDLSEAEIIEASSGPGSSIGELPMAEDLESSSSAAGEEESNEEGEIEDYDEEDAGTMLGVGYKNDQRNNTVTQIHSNNSVYEFQRSLQSHPSQSFLRHRSSHSGPSSGRNLQPHPITKADHDEALMASLSTLLSCAAAARGLPKVSQQGTSSPGITSRVPVSSSRVQLDTLQLVPDQVMAEKDIRGAAVASATETTQVDGRHATSVIPESTLHAKRNSTSRDSSKKRALGAQEPKTRSSSRSSRNHARHRSSSRSTKRHSKLTSTLSSTDASLLTLAVSAGAVIILSAISFSAGYVLGKEIGKAEAEVAADLVGRTGSMVKEAHRSGRSLVGVGRRVVSVTA
ncbi:hypothetical protein BDZ91DRAFT_436739 [Kalaharituber pfeilii]|nr:hypothetical protein BDZ91DRAFT_436739 [Kalaharituber pfeilii]